MGRRRITAGLVSLVMVVSAFLAPFAEMSTYAEEIEKDISTEEAAIQEQSSVIEEPKMATGEEKATGIIASGDCGASVDDDVTWEITKLGTYEYVLTISGNGAMADWKSYSYIPEMPPYHQWLLQRSLSQKLHSIILVIQ